ncbi:1-phosphofructokinase [Paenibacillus marinisediminis]
MIVTVTMNAAIDKTYMAPGFQPGSLHRIQEMYSYAGGKGINVARVVRTLNEDVIATGVVAGNNGRYIEAELDREGIRHDFVHVDGESRLCLNIIDPLKSQQTELLEAGPVLNEAALAEVLQKITALAAEASHVVMSGSLSQGCPVSFYAELTSAIRAAGAVPVLDASGDALIQGVSARPHLIKPNEHEVLKLTGGTALDEAAVKAAIISLMNDGVENVVVSLGGDGAIAGMGGRLYRVAIPSIEVVNTVGCGDSMLAGIVVAAKRGMSAADQLRLGAACGTANALMPAAGSVRLEDLEAIMPQVVVTEID